jgi:hypothetical protein
MDNKKLQSLFKRLQKANSSFGVMGSMILVMEFEQMTTEELEAFSVFVANRTDIGLICDVLDKKLSIQNS